ncbi:MAG: beta family protein [Devosia sp.]|nr:beta family protein [Devosia sp.]
MAITVLDYVPVLKWRQGEYQALMRLDENHRRRVVPLIEVTPPEWDFEEGRAKKTLAQQLEPFGRRLKAKWGAQPAFLDTHLLKPIDRMPGGAHPLTYLLDSTREDGAQLTPVTGLERDLAHYNAVAAAALIDGLGIAVRCSLDEIADPDFSTTCKRVVGQLGVDTADVDLIIDLAAKNFEPLDDLVDLVSALLQSDSIYDEVRSLILIGTSFPGSMGDIKPPGQIIPRMEWKLYKQLVASLPEGFELPTFGDYAISSADIPGGDMRLLKPAASVRYTIDDAWLITKGSNVRDNGFEQFRDRCGDVVNSGKALPPGYSAGSDYVRGCHGKTEKTGNLTTWRWVGTNHHITKVVDDLASLFGS